jgi:CBS domain-containing protein
MKVEEVMTSDVRSCRPDANLAEAVREMWEGDCGALPVVGADGQIVGIITDRDICVAVATRDRTADRIAVREVAHDQRIHTCLATDDATAALKIMQANKVRRLPVIDAQGHLRGIVSLNDIVTHAGAATATQIANTLSSICQHHTPAIASSAV